MHSFLKQFLTFVAITCITAGNLQAQTPEDSVKYHYGPMTIIGTRYAEPWIQVPLALSYIQPSDIPRGKGYGLDEALVGVPGVLVQSRFGNQDVRLTIRGFGARGAGERSNAGTSRGVRILSNGFPDTEPDGRTSFDLTEISGAGGIEVIRSNASSLYGNASGGVINIMSNTMFETPFVSFTESFGSYGFRKEMITAGAMVGSGKMYFSMSNTNWDGWRKQSRSSQMLLNMGIVSPLGESTTLGVHLSGTSNVFRIPGPLTEAQYTADPSQAQDDTLIYKPTYVQRDERRNNRLGRLGVKVTHELDDNNMIEFSAFAQPKFLNRSERNTYRDFNRYHVGGGAMYRNATMFGTDVHNTFLLGVDEAYQDGAILFYNLILPQTTRGSLRDNKREGANNLGAFLQDEISVGENLLFLLGGRYDNITYTSEGYLDPPDTRLSETKSFTHFTPKGGITYRVSPTHSVYANFGGGVEVPAGNETDPSGTVPGDTVNAINPLLEPIVSTTIEVGTKHIMEFGKGGAVTTLTYDVAAYWLQVTNDIIPYRGGRFYFTAGKSERMGLEVAANLQFAMGFSISAALTASKNTYKEYLVDSVHYSASLAGHYADYASNKITGVPSIFYNVGVMYMPEALKGAYIRASIQSVGEYFVNDANTISVPAYTILNAGLGVDHLKFANNLLYVSAFVGLNNLTDAKYIGSAWLNPDAPVIGGVQVPAYIEPGLPSNFVGSIGIGMNL
jgi:iron complex outermembrane receptor protein